MRDLFRTLTEAKEVPRWAEGNAARITDDSLFMRYDWYKEKRRTDKPNRYNWTEAEVSWMNTLRRQGFTIREIAEKMNRSESSIKYKMYGREKTDGRN